MARMSLRAKLVSRPFAFCSVNSVRRLFIRETTLNTSRTENALMLVLFIALVISFAIKDWVEGGVIAAVIGDLTDYFISWSRRNS